MSNTSRSGLAPEYADDAHHTARLLAELEAAILAEGPETVAMLIAEPVQNRGGCITPPEGYWQGLRALADRYGFLLVADEVITAFGRLGEWFGGDRYGARPDIVTVAKGITAGYAPMGATLVSNRVVEVINRPGTVLNHGYTFAGHPLSAAIALRSLEIMERDRILDNVRGPRTTWRGAWHPSRTCRSSATSAEPVLLRLRTRRRPRRRRLQRHRPRRPDRRPDPAPAARGRPARPRLQPRRPTGPDRAPADQRPRPSRPYRRHPRGDPRRGVRPPLTRLRTVFGKERHVLHRSADRRPRRARPGPHPVGTSSYGVELGIPLIVVNGAEDGPVLCVDAGVHGDEYDGQEAVRRVVAEVDPATLRGTLVGIPCMNTPAFEAAARTSGLDHLNLNRIFPGDADGSYSLRLAAAFVEQVVPAIDALVDLHTGGTFGEIAPLVILQGGYEELATDMALAAGHELVWKGGKWGGTVRHPTLAAGKPAITIEAGGGTYREENVALHIALDPQHPAAAQHDRRRGGIAGRLHRRLRHLRPLRRRRLLRRPRRTGGDLQGRRPDRPHRRPLRQHAGGGPRPAGRHRARVRRIRTVRPGDEVVIFGEVQGEIRP